MKGILCFCAADAELRSTRQRGTRRSNPRFSSPRSQKFRAQKNLRESRGEGVTCGLILLPTRRAELTATIPQAKVAVRLGEDSVIQIRCRNKVQHLPGTMLDCRGWTERRERWELRLISIRNLYLLRLTPSNFPCLAAVRQGHRLHFIRAHRLHMNCSVLFVLSSAFGVDGR